MAFKFYKKHIGHLFAAKPLWAAAAAFYLLYVLGTVLLVVMPASRSGSIRQLMLHAVLFGLCTYGAYDLTNWATLRDWPGIVVLVDMLWGVAVTAIISSAGYWYLTR